MTDATRQFGKTLADIRADHVKRYAFAARYAMGRVLDAACGCGYGSRILHDAGRAVIGIDIDGGAITWANENYAGPQYVHGDIERKPWEGTFDTVVSFETIEHLQRPDLALALFRNALLQGGKLIVSAPNENLYPFNAEKFNGDDYPHLRHYRPEELEDLLGICGFGVIEKWCQDSKSAPELKQGTEGKFLIFVCE